MVPVALGNAALFWGEFISSIPGTADNSIALRTINTQYGHATLVEEFVTTGT